MASSSKLFVACGFWLLVEVDQRLEDGESGKAKIQLVEGLGNKHGIHMNSHDPEEFMQVVVFNLAWKEICIELHGEYKATEMASEGAVPIVTSQADRALKVKTK